MVSMLNLRQYQLRISSENLALRVRESDFMIALALRVPTSHLKAVVISATSIAMLDRVSLTV